MYTLPTTVEVRNKVYTIRNAGDFRTILDCFAALRDDEIGEDARILASLIIFYENFDSIESLPDDSDTLTDLVKEMFNFMDGGQSESSGSHTDVSLIDWEQDSQMICAAVNKVANTEIRALSNLHWWTFLGYYMSVGESVLSTVVGIRDKVVHGKKLEKWEKEFKRNNPEYFKWRKQTVDAAEFDRIIREQFHGGAK